MITTKKGIDKPVVSFTANFTSQLKPTYADYSIMNSAQQMSVLGELERKGFLNYNVLDRPDYGVYGQMYKALDYSTTTGNFHCKILRRQEGIFCFVMQNHKR